MGNELGLMGNIGDVGTVGNNIGDGNVSIVAYYTVTVAFEAIIKTNGHSIWDKSKVE